MIFKMLIGVETTAPALRRGDTDCLKFFNLYFNDAGLNYPVAALTILI